MVIGMTELGFKSTNAQVLSHCAGPEGTHSFPFEQSIILFCLTVIAQAPNRSTDQILGLPYTILARRFLVCF